MKVVIFQGSFRPRGNTAAFLEPLCAELDRLGVGWELIALADKTIAPCTACWHCQDVPDVYGCAKEDDMQQIVAKLLEADGFLLATPIYTWYCTPPMKALMDRFFAMNKYYGKAPVQRLWEGKFCGVVATCGYEIPYGAGPFEDGVRRLCEHSHLHYAGMAAERDLDDRASFETPQARQKAVEYARHVAALCGKKTD